MRITGSRSAFFRSQRGHLKVSFLYRKKGLEEATRVQGASGSYSMGWGVW